MTDNKAAISTLNSLIETCMDGAKGYRTASENTGAEDHIQYVRDAASGVRRRASA